jgi:uncharacterized protein YdeI (YjbR/CyaY-like superfamily)/N-acetylglutamate synthase-like GNAT family acetyltransferase
MKDLEKLFIESLDDLRSWLDMNWSNKESIWLVYYKKSTGKADYTISDIIDVLLCYGWVDSLPKKYNEEKTQLRISPRNPKSNWSRVNKNKIKILTEKGLMHENGLKLIQIAKENGCWNALDEVEGLILPKDFKQELKSKDLLKNWEDLSRSVKRGFLESLLSAKKTETREKRIQKFIAENLVFKIQKVVIKEAKKSDIKEIFQVKYEAMKSSFGFLGIAEEDLKEECFSENKYQKYLTKIKEEIYLVAKYQSKLIGVIAMDNAGMLKTFWVKPDYQNRGVGTQLLESILEIGFKKYSEIKISTGDHDNNRAMKFYKKFGFKETGFRKMIKLTSNQKSQIESIELSLLKQTRHRC